MNKWHLTLCIVSFLLSTPTLAQNWELQIKGNPEVTLNSEVLTYDSTADIALNLETGTVICYVKSKNENDQVTINVKGDMPLSLVLGECYQIPNKNSNWTKIVNLFQSYNVTVEEIEGVGQVRGDALHYNIIVPEAFGSNLKLWLRASTQNAYVLIRTPSGDQRFEPQQTIENLGFSELLFEIPRNSLSPNSEIGFIEENRGVLYCGKIEISSEYQNLELILLSNNFALAPVIFTILGEYDQEPEGYSAFRTRIMETFSVCPTSI